MEQSLYTWLMESCGLSQQRASDTVELLSKDGIDSLSSLQSCIQGTPDALTETQLPKIQQILIKSKVLALNKVKLCDLSVSDVELLINNVCGKQYGSTFQLKEINGFVLTSVQSVEKLAEWGELSIIHANTLWFYLQQWKDQGVPHDLLQDNYGRLKLEQSQSSHGSSAVRVKQEPANSAQVASSAVYSQQQSTPHDGTNSNQRIVSARAGASASFNPTQLQQLASIAPPAESLAPPSGAAVPVPRKRSALAAGLDNDNIVVHTSAGTINIPVAVKQASMALNSGPKVRKVPNSAAERDDGQLPAAQVLMSVNTVSTSEPSKVAAAPPILLLPSKSPTREVKARATGQSVGKSRPDSRQSSNEHKQASSGSRTCNSDGDSDSSDDSSSDFDSSSDDSEATTPQKHPRATRKLSPQFARISQRTTKGTAPSREASRSPIVRSSKKPQGKLSRELLSLYKETNPPPRSASANSTNSADSSKKGSAKKAAPQGGKFKPIGGSAASSPVDSAVMATMKRHLQMLFSTDAEKQLEALKYYSSYAAKHPLDIKTIRITGATEKMINMVATPHKYDEMNLWKALVALNNIAAVKIERDTSDTDFMIAKHLVPTLIPLCHHTSKRVRLQALWLVGNIAISEVDTATQKTTIITPALVSAIVESFATRGNVTDNVADITDFRYAETIQQIVNAKRPPQTRRLFGQFIPVLRDIFQHFDNLEASSRVRDALVALLRYEPAFTATGLVDHDVLSALMSRLDSTSKVTFVGNALEILLAFARSCERPQLDVLAKTVVHLRRIVVSSTDKDARRMLIAIECMSTLCEARVPAALSVVLGRSSAQLIEKLASLVIPVRETQMIKGDLAEASALLLARLTLVADAMQLAQLLDHSLYSALFNALDLFDDDAYVVELSLNALHKIIPKTKQIQKIQAEEEGDGMFRAAQAWELVQRMARQRVKGAEEMKIRELYQVLLKVGEMYSLVVKT